MNILYLMDFHTKTVFISHYMLCIYDCNSETMTNFSFRIISPFSALYCCLLLLTAPQRSWLKKNRCLIRSGLDGTESMPFSPQHQACFLSTVVVTMWSESETNLALDSNILDKLLVSALKIYNNILNLNRKSGSRPKIHRHT
jgi:hypothetical protein